MQGLTVELMDTLVVSTDLEVMVMVAVYSSNISKEAFTKLIPGNRELTLAHDDVAVFV